MEESMMHQKAASAKSGRLILGLNVVVFSVTVLCCAIRWEARGEAPGAVVNSTVPAAARPLGAPPPKIYGAIQGSWVSEDTPPGHVVIFLSVNAAQNPFFTYTDTAWFTVNIDQSDEQITADLRAGIAEVINDALASNGIVGFHYTANDIRGCSR
jgi:hypothetical protein